MSCKQRYLVVGLHLLFDAKCRTYLQAGIAHSEVGHSVGSLQLDLQQGGLSCSNLHCIMAGFL